MEKEKRQKFAEYIQSIAAIEDSMRPYREQRKDLRRNFTAIYESIETGFAEKEVSE